MPPSKIRVLILIVAYNAEDTLCAVLDRIPERVLADFACEVLVIDDASGDETFERGLSYRQSRPDLPLTVLRNSSNQGYGGNQKLGYMYAIEEGFDLVALIHGDGQYAPEDLPRLLQPLAAGQTDAVLGSRMLEHGAALKGRMPLYKFVGNKILTMTQNTLIRAQLSEWHSGYRLYRVKTLSSLRFLANHNDFRFDTQIILQLLAAQARIAELPIPTYYGTEICRVDGVRYAGQVVRATVSAALHRTGLGYDRKLVPLAAGNAHYDVKLDFPSSHTRVLSAISPGSRVLDLGSGPGAFATALVEAGAVVETADLYAPQIHDSRITTHVADLNQPLELPLDAYDDLLMLDVLEHLADPDAFLEDLHRQLGDRPRRLIITTPNIAFVGPRLLLLLGRFDYGQQGILDRTHTRLFTFRSLRRAVRDAGYDVNRMAGIPAPFEKVVRPRWLARGMSAVNRALITVFPRLFAYQLYLEATNRPHPAHVLAATRASADSAA